MIEQDTIRLLRECDAGIQMGISSIEDMLPRVENSAFRDKMKRCKAEHEKLEREVREELDRYQDEGKSPSKVVQGMSAAKTSVMFAMDATDETAASLITDGCSMGVKSLNQYLNEYEAADERSKDIAKRLIHLEQQLATDIRAYL